jgi:hypothetical protein
MRVVGATPFSEPSLGVGNRQLGVGVEHQRGGALLPVMLIMFLFSAIAFGASIVVRTEVTVSARHRRATEALYAADAGLAIALGELREIPAWTPVLNGTVTSAFSRGGFQGTAAVPGGGTVTLCCGAGSAADRAVNEGRLSTVPARRALEWQPFLWSPMDSLVDNSTPSGFFIVVFVADDEDDADDADPRKDVNGIVMVRAEALEGGGVHRTVEALVARRDPSAEAGPRPAVGILRWREIR